MKPLRRPVSLVIMTSLVIIFRISVTFSKAQKLVHLPYLQNMASSTPKILAADWNSANLGHFRNAWSSDSYNRVFSLTPMMTPPCTSFQPRLLGQAVVHAFRGAYNHDGVKAPAVCLKFQSTNSNPEDQTCYILQPINFVVLKAFQGYMPMDEKIVNKEKSYSRNKVGQWYGSLFKGNAVSVADAPEILAKFPIHVVSTEAMTPNERKLENEYDAFGNEGENNQDSDPVKKNLPFDDQNDDDATEKYDDKVLEDEDDVDVGGANPSTPRPKTSVKVPRQQGTPSQPNHFQMVDAQTMARRNVLGRFEKMKKQVRMSEFERYKAYMVKQGKPLADELEIPQVSDVDEDSEFENAVEAETMRLKTDPRYIWCPENPKNPNYVPPPPAVIKPLSANRSSSSLSTLSSGS